MAGWLHTKINARHRELNPDTVTYLSTNQAGRRLTLLIEANALTTTPYRRHDYHYLNKNFKKFANPTPNPNPDHDHDREHNLTIK